MTAFLGRLFTLFLIVLAVFAASRYLIRALPGNPVETVLAESGSTLPPRVLAARLGLDRPFGLALRQDLLHALQGNFGHSLVSRAPIGALLVSHLLNTLWLTILALLVGLPLSLWLGLLAADRAGSFVDRLCTFHGVLCAALPTPWIGPLFLLVFSVWIPLLPIGNSIWAPALTLAFVFSGLWARLVRERVRESLLFGAARGARARGIPEWKVLVKYGLIPVSGSLLAYLGTQLGHLLAGAFVTEMIFDWHGMGHLFVSAVLRRDYPVVEAATFVSATVCLFANWLGDLFQKQVQP